MISEAEQAPLAHHIQGRSDASGVARAGAQTQGELSLRCLLRNVRQTLQLVPSRRNSLL